MSEAEAWEGLRPRLQALGLDPQRVENVLAGGTPDVWYSRGAIENKYLPAWPVRDSTPVDIGLTKEQMVWLTRRWNSGGPCWVALQVRRQVLLLSGFDSRDVFRGLTHPQLAARTCWMSDANGRGNWAALKAWLTWDQDELPPPARARLLRLRCGRTIPQAASLLGVETSAVEAAEREETLLTNDLIDAWVA